ncbi:MAG: amidase, partial [Rhodospirillaceae bacterium]|nr:amidase [Rhodospirillaceae bacterium]
MTAKGELWRLGAADVVDLLRRREVSPLELVEASAERIAATDGHLNAIPTLCIDRARAHAERIMAEDPETERPRGWLGGVPIAVKDLVEVEGVRTTWGSPIFADHVPPRSDIAVETLEARGAIVIGKSNTPEFGAGANTFNEVFGKTRNPWN